MGYAYGLGTFLRFFFFNFCEWWQDLQNSRSLNPSKNMPYNYGIVIVCAFSVGIKAKVYNNFGQTN